MKTSHDGQDLEDGQTLIWVEESGDIKMVEIVARSSTNLFGFGIIRDNHTDESQVRMLHSRRNH